MKIETQYSTTVAREVSEIASWDHSADVVIVGLGGAGACAALEANRAGADVLVLERAAGGGGTTALSGGLIYCGGGTSVQKACGFEDSPEDMFNYLMAACGPGPDEAKIQTYAENSVAHFDWLVAQGIPFRGSFYPESGTEPPTQDGLIFSGNENAHPFCELAKPAARGHHPAKEGAAGGFLMQKLLGTLEKTNVTIKCNAFCKTLVVDRNGAVVGAIAVVDQKEIAVRARRGVILTAGGFVNNKEMLRRYAPELLRCRVRIGCEGDDGTGIRMGLGAGAEAIRMHAGSISLPYYPPKQLKKGILINRYGQRFINEDVYYGRAGEFALLRQDGKVYLIVDDEIYAKPIGGMELAAVGENAAELEATLGLPSDSLQSTLAFYNANAARGEDPLFHKAKTEIKPLTQAPLGALDLTCEKSVYAVFTLGGLRTTINGEVFNPDGKTIPGLYAAGRTTSGVCAQGYSSGLSIADATYFGRRAGIAASKRDTKKSLA